ncbi:MAG: c-type cytochrome [Gallionella sp.]
MKTTFGLMLVAAIALTGCNKTDERAAVGKQVGGVYERMVNRPKVIAVGDAKAGKVIAEKCVACHGIDGVLAKHGAPFIAGIEQDYMVSALLAYSDGSRKNDPMKQIADELKRDPEVIADVSAYFASLKTPWAGANVGNVSASIVSYDKMDIKAGATLASGCLPCHGGKSQSMPVLAAMTPEYFVPALHSYFTGIRDNGPMKIFSSAINESDAKRLAAYFATQPPVKVPLAGVGDVRMGERQAGICAGCHSIDGNALNPNIPSLAGQPAEYLIKAMKDYRDGIRHDPMMVSVLNGFQDDTIANLGAYYASQIPESPYVRAAKEGSKFEPLVEGAKIAGSCDGCHGKNGNSTKPGFPSLTGQNVKYLFSATRDYRDGIRKNALMSKMVGTLSDTDIEKVAYHYATHTPSSNKPAPKADLASGEKISGGCVSCHGERGVSNTPGTPSLAGQDASYLAAATRAYARGERKSDAMSGPTKELKTEDIVNVTAYFATQKAVRPDTVLPLSPQYSISKKCSRCHGENGRSTEPGIPGLAGQSEAYLVMAIKEYHDGVRKQHMMNAMSDVLSLTEMKAIAAYYARQKPKGSE